VGAITAPPCGAAAGGGPEDPDQLGLGVVGRVAAEGRPDRRRLIQPTSSGDSQEHKVSR
jgi:hypothetical protein